MCLRHRDFVQLFPNCFCFDRKLVLRGLVEDKEGYSTDESICSRQGTISTQPLGILSPARRNAEET
jgi:hypothetical protein